MADVKYKNKVVYDGEVLIDLTADTITADKLASGITAHDKSGALIIGTSTKDSDTSNDTAAVAEILKGKTAHARGVQLVGTMPNNGAVTGTISTKAGSYTIPQGYHDGSGKVAISTTAQTVQPDSGYDYLSAVTVEKIPYVEAENAAGGITVTIG